MKKLAFMLCLLALGTAGGLLAQRIELRQVPISKAYYLNGQIHLVDTNGNMYAIGTNGISAVTLSGVTANAGTITTVNSTTANITTGKVSVLVTGTVPFAVSVDTVTNAAGAAIKVLKLTP
jgi:hypothetical protein